LDSGRFVVFTTLYGFSDRRIGRGGTSADFFEIEATCFNFPDFVGILEVLDLDDVELIGLDVLDLDRKLNGPDLTGAVKIFCSRTDGVDEDNFEPLVDVEPVVVLAVELIVLEVLDPVRFKIIGEDLIEDVEPVVDDLDDDDVEPVVVV
jgi:hypothetical protein